MNVRISKIRSGCCNPNKKIHSFLQPMLFVVWLLTLIFSWFSGNLAQSTFPTAAPSYSQGWAYFSSYQQTSCTGSVYAVVALPLNQCIPQYNLTSVIYYLKYSCTSSAVTTSYYTNSACTQTSSSVPASAVAPTGCDYNYFNMTTNLQCTANTQTSSLIPSTGYYWAINTTYANPYALNGVSSCGTVSEVVILMQSTCYINTGLGSASGVKSFKITYSTTSSQFIISTYTNYYCSSSTPSTTTLYAYCAPYAIGNNYYAREIWSFTSTAAPTVLPSTVVPSRAPTYTAAPSTTVPSAIPSSRKPSSIPSSAAPTFTTQGYAYFNSYSTPNNCSNSGAIVAITAYPLQTCIPVYNISSNTPIYFRKYSCSSNFANVTLYSNAACTHHFGHNSTLSQTINSCTYKALNLTASLQCSNTSNVLSLIPYISGVTWNINMTYANPYGGTTQSCSNNLLSVAQIYRNNYCFPSSIEGNAYRSFSISGSSSTVNSYTANSCSGTLTAVTVYSACHTYPITGSNVNMVEYWTLLYSNQPPTSKPTAGPTSLRPTRSPTSVAPSFTPSLSPTRKPSISLVGYAYFNSYSGSKCTGSVAAITAYPIGICIPQYNTTTIVRYVYYNCNPSVITVSYFKDSGCSINVTSPVLFPIVNNTCRYTFLNLSAAGFCNTTTAHYTSLIPKTVGSSWNINESFAAPLAYSGNQYCSTVNMVQMYLNNYCFTFSYNGYKSFLTRYYSSTLTGYVYEYVNPFCGSGSFSSVSLQTSCSAYSINSGKYVENIWTLGFSFSLPTTIPTIAPTISFVPTYAPSSKTPSGFPSTLPTISPSVTITGYAYFYSYTIKGCTGSIIAVTAFPIGVCIPQYNLTTIKNYIKYSCDSKAANATKYVDSSCTVPVNSPLSTTSYPLLKCAYTTLNYSSNVQCSSSSSYYDLVPAIPGTVWSINVSYATPFQNGNYGCGIINTVQIYQNSWCFPYSQNGYKSFKLVNSNFEKFTVNSGCTSSFSSTNLQTTCTTYSLSSVGYVNNIWILNYALTMSPTFSPSLFPTTYKPSSILPSTIPSIAPTTMVPSISPSSRTPTAPTSIPMTSKPSSIAPSVSPSSSVLPSVYPSIVPSLAPTFAPIIQSPLPSNSPSMTPSVIITTLPSESPTALSTLLSPTYTPSILPTILPTSSPSSVPSLMPSSMPTDLSTHFPTTLPSQEPLSSLTFLPSALPSADPSEAPSSLPTMLPTEIPSQYPTTAPTLNPTYAPTQSPTALPTTVPSQTPVATPTSSPSKLPSADPSESPSSFSTVSPTSQPTTFPSQDPVTKAPSVFPSADPSETPSSFSTVLLYPTISPSSKVSNGPTESPTRLPTTFPSQEPATTSTAVPSYIPTADPSETPSSQPTKLPFLLSDFPSNLPSTLPSSGITSEAPTLSNSVAPSETSSQLPSASPSSISLSSYPTAAPFSTTSTDTPIVPSITGSPVGFTFSLSPSGSPSLSLSSSPSQHTSINPTDTPLSTYSISPTAHVLTPSPSRTPSGSPVITTAPTTKDFAIEPSAVPSIYSTVIPSSLNNFTEGYIFTNSYASSSCLGEPLFSFGDFLGYCYNISSNHTSYKYLINQESCGSILKLSFTSLNCSGPIATEAFELVESYPSTTDYQMAGVSCVNGIISNCSLTRPYPVQNPFVMGEVYDHTCSDKLAGYLQSATNVCYNSNSGTTAPYQFVLQATNGGYFSTYFYTTLSACDEDVTRTNFSQEDSSTENTCIIE